MILQPLLLQKHLLAQQSHSGSCLCCQVIAHLCEKVGLNFLEKDIVTMIVLPHIVLGAFITQHADLQQHRRALLFRGAPLVS